MNEGSIVMQVGIYKSHGNFKKSIGTLIPRWDLRRGIRNSRNSLSVRVLSNKQVHNMFLNEFAIKVELASSANLKRRGM